MANTLKKLEDDELHAVQCNECGAFVGYMIIPITAVNIFEMSCQCWYCRQKKAIK